VTDALYRLAYYSLNALPGDRDAAAEVQRILAASRRNNARARITGALLFTRGRFAQILEGDYAAVERVFETIQNDERHTGVVPLQFEAVPERGFGPWSMAYGVGVAADFDPATCTGAEMFRVLRAVLLAQERPRASA
jgi:hypothetical protein